MGGYVCECVTCVYVYDVCAGMHVLVHMCGMCAHSLILQNWMKWQACKRSIYGSSKDTLD